MNCILGRAAMLVCALLGMTATLSSADATTPPKFQALDANGVDLVSGGFVFTMMEGSIGSGPGEVTLMRIPGTDYGRTDQYSGRLYRDSSSGTTLLVVELGTIADTFTISGTTYTSTKANGGTLSTDGAGNYTYVGSDGTSIYYQSYNDDGSGTLFPLKGPVAQ